MHAHVGVLVHADGIAVHPRSTTGPVLLRKQIVPGGQGLLQAVFGGTQIPASTVPVSVPPPESVAPSLPPASLPLSPPVVPSVLPESFTDESLSVILSAPHAATMIM